MNGTSAQPHFGATAAIINPLLSSVIETFRDVLDCDVQRGQLELREPDAEVYDISAMISLSGQAKGVVCLSFEQLTALEIAARMLGRTTHRITAPVLDGIGEIANMVAGAAKSKLSMGLNMSLNMGLPNVVRRADYSVRFPSESEPMRLHFDSEVGPFFVDFGFVISSIGGGSNLGFQKASIRL